MTEHRLPPWEEAFLTRDVRFDRKATLGLTTRVRRHVRNWFGRRMLSGRGIEIGAQYIPTQIDPRRASVEYVDAVSNEHLGERYELGDTPLVELDHLLEATNLAVYGDGARDFLIAHHVLEHIDDPVGAVVEWLRVLRDGGLLYISVPNFRGNYYDFRRSPPSRAHLLLDRTDPAGRPTRNLDHYREMVMTMWGLPRGDPRIEQTAQAWTQAGERQHYHVFDEGTLRDVLELAAHESECGLQVEGFVFLDHGFEWLVLARKTRDSAGLAWPGRQWSRLMSAAAITSVIVAEGWIRTVGKLGRRG